jgi:hypothetical protein
VLHHQLISVVHGEAFQVDFLPLMKNFSHAHQVLIILTTLTLAKDLLLMEESLQKEQEEKGEKE